MRLQWKILQHYFMHRRPYAGGSLLHNSESKGNNFFLNIKIFIVNFTPFSH